MTLVLRIGMNYTAVVYTPFCPVKERKLMGTVGTVYMCHIVYWFEPVKGGGRCLENLARERGSTAHVC